MLFPALVAAGLPERGGDLDALLQEHVEGRRHIAAMEAALRPTVDAKAFGAAALAYAGLLRRHIRTENEVLFPLAERTLSPEKLAELFEAFEAHEAEVIGPGRHEALHALLKALKARYTA
jgi:hemerythrin-like domain-containing protein